MERKKYEKTVPPVFFGRIVNGLRKVILWSGEETWVEGDILVLREYDKTYTDRIAVCEITEALEDIGGMQRGYVLLSLSVLWNN